MSSPFETDNNDRKLKEAGDSYLQDRTKSITGFLGNSATWTVKGAATLIVLATVKSFSKISNLFKNQNKKPKQNNNSSVSSPKKTNTFFKDTSNKVGDKARNVMSKQNNNSQQNDFETKPDLKVTKNKSLFATANKQAEEKSKLKKTLEKGEQIQTGLKIAQVAKTVSAGGVAAAGGPIGITLVAAGIAAPMVIGAIWKNRNKVYEAKDGQVTNSQINLDDTLDIIKSKQGKVGETMPEAKGLKIESDEGKTLFEADEKGKILTNDLPQDKQLYFFQEDENGKPTNLVTEPKDLKLDLASQNQSLLNPEGKGDRPITPKMIEQEKSDRFENSTPIAEEADNNAIAISLYQDGKRAETQIGSVFSQGTQKYLTKEDGPCLEGISIKDIKGLMDMKNQQIGEKTNNPDFMVKDTQGKTIFSTDKDGVVKTNNIDRDLTIGFNKKDKMVFYESPLTQEKIARENEGIKLFNKTSPNQNTDSSTINHDSQDENIVKNSLHSTDIPAAILPEDKNESAKTNSAISIAEVETDKIQTNINSSQQDNVVSSNNKNELSGYKVILNALSTLKDNNPNNKKINRDTTNLGNTVNIANHNSQFKSKFNANEAGSSLIKLFKDNSKDGLSLSTKDYEITRRGKDYTLADKSGNVLLTARDSGMFGTGVYNNNLSSEHKQDLKYLKEDLDMEAPISGGFNKNTKSAARSQQVNAENSKTDIDLGKTKESNERVNIFEQEKYKTATNTNKSTNRDKTKKKGIQLG